MERNKALEKQRLDELGKFKGVKFYPDKVDTWTPESWNKFIGYIKDYRNNKSK